MILGNQVEWALHSMTVLGSLPQGIKVPAKILAEFHGVPKEYLAKAMQSLAQAGLVHTSLGPKGGYSLAKSPDDITVLDIVEAVEGKKNTFNCAEIRQNIPCTPKNHKSSKVCPIAAVMYEADYAWRGTLRKKRLSDLIKNVGDQVPSDILMKSQKWLLEQI